MIAGTTMGRTDMATRVMGVVNVTPDSFYTPSQTLCPQDACRDAERLVAEGADIIDIGGESSRPGAEPLDAAMEMDRVVPVLKLLGSSIGATLSIDTYHAATARAAIAHGATMVNDITALQGDPAMSGVIADECVECVLMHMQGTPETMQNRPQYGDIVDDVCAFFEERIAFATAQGIPEENIWLDPGFGFGKSVCHNIELLRRLSEFKRFGLRVLIGTSNKSTIGAVLGLPVEDRLEGTAATVAIAIQNGADCVRVHDVKAMARVARMSDAAIGKVVYG